VLEKNEEDQLESSYKNKVVLNTVKGDRNILYAINRMISEWILPKQVIEEKMKGTKRRRRRRRKQLLDDLKETRGYCKLKREALDRLCGELALKKAMDMS
jgi:hypothetical protein